MRRNTNPIIWLAAGLVALVLAIVFVPRIINWGTRYIATNNATPTNVVTQDELTAAAPEPAATESAQPVEETEEPVATVAAGGADEEPVLEPTAVEVCDRKTSELSPRQIQACEVTPTATTAPAGEGNPQAPPATTSYTSTLGAPIGQGDLFRVWGVPQSVDPTVIDRANHDGFTSKVDTKLGDGKVHTVSLPEADFILANMGKINYGPGENQDTIDQSRGAGEFFNPLNQAPLLYEAPAFWRCPEGGFNGFTFGGGVVHMGDITLEMQGDGQTTFQGYIRCRNADSDNTDRNLDLELLAFSPGNVELVQFSGAPAGGFVSLGQAAQRAYTAHTSGSGNCGNDTDNIGGCSKVYLVLMDFNTGAVRVLRQVGVDGPWTVVYTNFQ